MRRIKPGVNDIQTLHPELLQEWDYDKNDVQPSSVGVGSHKKRWWICSKGHSYDATIAHRLEGKGCPFCSGKRALAGYNDLESQYPNIAAEWHPDKNGSLKPSEVAWGSNKKVWWKCNNCKSEWAAVINKRTSSGQSCPYCGPIAKQVKVGVNDLGTTDPDVASEWHPTKNIGITPQDVTRGSNRIAWWTCSKCESEFEAKVAARTRGGGCPYCAGKRIKQGFNDLASRYPEIAAEWHPTKNGTVMPNQVFPRSEKQYWWKCLKCGHEWKASPDSRVGRSGCPKCGRFIHTSFPEQAILFYLRKAFPDAIGQFRDFGYELDIYIPSVRIAVEYDGFFYHGEEKVLGVSDRKKDLLCIDNDITLIRIREPGLRSTSNAVNIKRRDLSDASLNDCIEQLLSYLNCEMSVSVEVDQAAILAQYSCTRLEDSLLVQCPQLAVEWHPTKNGDLNPSAIPAGSGRKVWWKCPTCHGEWNARVVDRAQGRGCPYCKNQRVLSGFNDLETRFPDIAKEWHPTKNGILTPRDILATSNKKAWWLCRACGNEWHAQISSRTSYGTGCRKCSSAKKVSTNRKNRIKRGALSLDKEYPGLASEWHPTKNGSLDPFDVTHGSGLKVWWKCSLCGKEWQQSIHSRVRYNAVACLDCRRRQAVGSRNHYEESFTSALSEIHSSIVVIGKYKNAHTKIKLRCLECGNVWSALPYSILRSKYGCPKCAKEKAGKTRRKDPDRFKAELKKKSPNLELLESYVTNKSKIRCRCAICGHTWSATPSKLLQGQRCPNCSNRSKK